MASCAVCYMRCRKCCRRPVPQERFLGLVSAETLLVGHALENDLRVLRVLHGRVVDTAILYPHPKACCVVG